MRSRIARSQGRVLAWLQRSPVVADKIPWQLRALDITLALLALPFVLLLGLIVAVAVLVDSPGPIFYRSKRIGRGGREFSMLKFRTMRHDMAGPSLSVKGDVRYTPVGRSLSATRLDELPQLYNVLRGDMRLVGPRPEVREFVEAFPAEYERILSVPPGLTGPSQLEFATEGRLLAEAADRSRFYRETVLPRKVSIDLAYAARHSALRDLLVLLGTVVLPLRQLWMVARLGFAGHHPSANLARGAVLAGALTCAVLAFTGLVVAEANSPF